MGGGGEIWVGLHRVQHGAGQNTFWIKAGIQNEEKPRWDLMQSSMWEGKTSLDYTWNPVQGETWVGTLMESGTRGKSRGIKA